LTCLDNLSVGLYIGAVLCFVNNGLAGKAQHRAWASFYASISIQRILKGSLQHKLKEADVWPFSARIKVATGWVCHMWWSLYRYCIKKKSINVNCS